MNTPLIVILGQILLLNAMKDVTSSLSDLIKLAQNAKGKDSDDEAVKDLKAKALVSLS